MDPRNLDSMKATSRGRLASHMVGQLAVGSAGLDSGEGHGFPKRGLERSHLLTDKAPS